METVETSLNPHLVTHVVSYGQKYPQNGVSKATTIRVLDINTPVVANIQDGPWVRIPVTAKSFF